MSHILCQQNTVRVWCLGSKLSPYKYDARKGLAVRNKYPQISCAGVKKNLLNVFILFIFL